MYSEAQVADIILFIKRTTHLIISSIAVVVLINIWQNYYSAKVRSFHRTAKDYGLLFLCGGILVWGFVSLLGLLKGNKNELAGWVLSTINNGFFLCSFAYFRHGLEWFNSEKNKSNWLLFIGVSTIIIIVTICMLAPHADSYKLDYIDFVYSSLTLLFLGGLLFKSFEARRLYAVAYISIGIVFLAIYGQLLPLLKDYSKVNEVAFGIQKAIVFVASHGLMIGIFISLAFSWVIENSEMVKEIKEDEIATAFLDKYGDSADKVESRLGEMLAEDQLYYVLLIAKEFFQRKGQTKDREMLTSLSVISGRLTSLKVAERNGTISREDYSRERSKIHEALKDVVEEISENIKTRKSDPPKPQV